MSNFLNTLSRASSVAAGVGTAARNLGGILNGSAFAGPPQALTLGGFDFQGFEVPERINFGGHQQMVVHRLPGGERVIDTMGRDDALVQWSGIFLGPGAAARARAVDEMRIQGAEVDLAFGDQYIPSLIIASFDADYRREAWVPYRISLMVLDPGTGIKPAVSGVAATGGLLGGLADEIGGTISDLAATGQAILNEAQSVVGAVSSVVTPITSALGISVPFLSQAQVALSGAQGLVNGLGQAGAGISSLGGQVASGVSAIGGIAQDGIAAVSGAATSLQQASVTATGIVNRMDSALGSLTGSLPEGVPVSPSTIGSASVTVGGTAAISLMGQYFAIAGKQLSYDLGPQPTQAELDDIWPTQYDAAGNVIK